MKKIIGYSILALIFIGIFTLTVIATGFLAALTIWIVSILVAALAIFAVHLTTSN